MLDKSLWRGEELMARGLLERPFLFTHKNTLSLKTLSLCRDAVCECVRACVRAPALLTFSHPPLFSFHTHPTRTRTLPFLLEDANIAHDKAPVDSSQTKHFLSKAVHLYAELIQRIAKARSLEKPDFHQLSVIPSVYLVSLH